jgi:hypothetical protein
MPRFAATSGSGGGRVVNVVRCARCGSGERRTARLTAHCRRHTEVVQSAFEGLRPRRLRRGGSGGQSSGRDHPPVQQEAKRALQRDLRPVRRRQGCAIGVFHGCRQGRPSGVVPGNQQSPTVFRHRDSAGQIAGHVSYQWAIRGHDGAATPTCGSERRQASTTFPRCISGGRSTAHRGAGCALLGRLVAAPGGTVVMVAVEGCG